MGTLLLAWSDIFLELLLAETLPQWVPINWRCILFTLTCTSRKGGGQSENSLTFTPSFISEPPVYPLTYYLCVVHRSIRHASVFHCPSIYLLASFYLPFLLQAKPYNID